MRLFNMTPSCVCILHAINKVEKTYNDNNGQEWSHSVWKSLKGWYLYPTHKDAMISHLERNSRKFLFIPIYLTLSIYQQLWDVCLKYNKSGWVLYWLKHYKTVQKVSGRTGLWYESQDSWRKFFWFYEDSKE